MMGLAMHLTSNNNTQIPFFTPEHNGEFYNLDLLISTAEQPAIVFYHNSSSSFNRLFIHYL